MAVEATLGRHTPDLVVEEAGEATIGLYAMYKVAELVAGQREVLGWREGRDKVATGALVQYGQDVGCFWEQVVRAGRGR